MMTLTEILAALTALSRAEVWEVQQAAWERGKEMDMMESAPARMEEIATEFEQAVAGDAPIPHADLPETIGPGQTIIWTDGETYRNDSRAWLPRSASPDTYRLGWTRLTLPDPDSLRRWALGESYEAGEYVYHEGVIASAVQAHRADDPAWAPGMAGTDALWKVHGTVEPEPEPDPEPEPEYPAWDPAATYYPPAEVTHKGEVWDLIHTHASPGWEPGDPAMHAVWKARVV